MIKHAQRRSACLTLPVLHQWTPSSPSSIHRERYSWGRPAHWDIHQLDLHKWPADKERFYTNLSQVKAMMAIFNRIDWPKSNAVSSEQEEVEEEEEQRQQQTTKTVTTAERQWRYQDLSMPMLPVRRKWGCLERRGLPTRQKCGLVSAFQLSSGS